MMERKRLSYANLMATFAVLVALGGTAYAAATITGADVQNNSLTDKDIKDGGLEARSAESADPRAFALVADGTVSSSLSKGITQANVTAVTTPSETDVFYCFKGLPFKPRGGHATGEIPASGDALPVTLSVRPDPTGLCPPATDAIVDVNQGNDQSFYVSFYR